MKNLIKKFINRETITYVIFGVLTTVINYACYWLLRMTGIDPLINNIIAWIAAVLFAFITNKLFVFESKSFAFTVLIKELAAFVAARLLSFFFEEGFLAVTVKLLHMNDLLAKLIASIFVIIFNYFASKFFIFRKKAKHKGDSNGSEQKN